ncbi:MAG: pyrroline-5-carboxylate reductase, partial [Desulfobulbaceae bacterium]|nr:pyrroline-5-carboxylate reductase [Desulfobulbaceae bacterium]
ISIAAGLPIAFYKEIIGKTETKIIRVMPNTPALVLEGASALSRNSNVSNEELKAAEEIFLAVGEVVILDEVHLDAVTGLSGSGRAYVFSFVEALIDAGVKSGLTRVVSEKLALQTVLGSVKLLKESGEHPAALRGKVTSPGGTAITAIHVLEKVGFHGIIMDVVESAVIRSKQLGEME